MDDNSRGSTRRGYHTEREFLIDFVRRLSRLYTGKTKGQQSVWNKTPDGWPEKLGPWKNPTVGTKDRVDLLQKKLEYLRKQLPVHELPEFVKECLLLYERRDLKKIFSLINSEVAQKHLESGFKMLEPFQESFISLPPESCRNKNRIPRTVPVKRKYVPIQPKPQQPISGHDGSSPTMHAGGDSVNPSTSVEQIPSYHQVIRNVSNQQVSPMHCNTETGPKQTDGIEAPNKDSQGFWTSADFQNQVQSPFPVTEKLVCSAEEEMRSRENEKILQMMQLTDDPDVEELLLNHEQIAMDSELEKIEIDDIFDSLFDDPELLAEIDTGQGHRLDPILSLQQTVL